MFLQLEMFGETEARQGIPAIRGMRARNIEDMRLDEFFAIYLNAVRFRLKSAEQKASRLRYLERFFKNCLVENLKKIDLLEFIEHRQHAGKKLSTISADLLALSGAYNHMKKNYGWKLQNPVSGLPFHASEKRVRYIEKHEAKRLIERARAGQSRVLADFIELALCTGGRRNELLQLRFQNIDERRRILTIEGKTTKTGQTRHIPINDTAQSVFDRRAAFRKECCPESPWVFCKPDGQRTLSLSTAFRMAVKRAGIEDFRIHDLRHTFASWLTSEGVELAKIRDLLGHSSIKMTERYAHLAPNRLHEAVNVLDGYMD